MLMTIDDTFIHCRLPFPDRHHSPNQREYIAGVHDGQISSATPCNVGIIQTVTDIEEWRTLVLPW